jgi:hypothetical protein
MKTLKEVPVTLSTGLLNQLRSRAAGLEIPLEWLVAGLVCDTIESCTGVHPTSLADTPGARRMRSRPGSIAN